MESGDDSLFTGPNNTDIGSYMYANSVNGWYGFTASGGAGYNATDLLIWMDWPGFVTGTTNVSPVIKQTVPQSSGGTDAFGNPINAYMVETTEVPAGTVKGAVQFVFLVPLSLTNNTVYTQFGINYLGAPNSLTATGVDYTLDVIDLNYTGPNWPHGHYRMYTVAGAGAGWVTGDPGTPNPNNFFFKANS
jgi:hypothetical protein